MSGKSGGTCRPNVDEVNNHCDHVAEREVTQPYGYRVVPYRVGTTANDMKLGIFAIKVPLLRFSLSYTFPKNTDRRPRDDRPTTDRTPRDQKVLFINICFPDRVTYFPKKVDSFSKKVD